MRQTDYQMPVKSTKKLVILTLLDTELRVAELTKHNKDNLDWQNHRLMIYGKGISPVGAQHDNRCKVPTMLSG